jgi:hypothetical protein
MSKNHKNNVTTSINSRSQWPCRLRLRVHWSQNRHNTTVWTDSKQGSIQGMSKKFGEWYQKTKDKRRYKQINYLGL